MRRAYLSKKTFNDGDRVCSLVCGKAYGIPATITGKSQWILNNVQYYIITTDPIPGHPDGMRLCLPPHQIGLIDERDMIIYQ